MAGTPVIVRRWREPGFPETPGKKGAEFENEGSQIILNFDSTKPPKRPKRKTRR